VRGGGGFRAGRCRKAGNSGGIVQFSESTELKHKYLAYDRNLLIYDFKAHWSQKAIKIQPVPAEQGVEQEINCNLVFHANDRSIIFKGCIPSETWTQGPRYRRKEKYWPKKTIFSPKTPSKCAIQAFFDGIPVMGVLQQDKDTWHMLEREPKLKPGDEVLLKLNWKKKASFRFGSIRHSICSHRYSSGSSRNTPITHNWWKWRASWIQARNRSSFHCTK